MVCNDVSSIQYARNTLMAYRACAQELMMRCVCSATDRLLVKVTPIILITVTRLIFGSGGEGCISSFPLRLLSTTKNVSILVQVGRQIAGSSPVMNMYSDLHETLNQPVEISISLKYSICPQETNSNERLRYYFYCRTSTEVLWKVTLWRCNLLTKW